MISLSPMGTFLMGSFSCVHCSSWHFPHVRFFIRLIFIYSFFNNYLMIIFFLVEAPNAIWRKLIFFKKSLFCRPTETETIFHLWRIQICDLYPFFCINFFYIHKKKTLKNFRHPIFDGFYMFWDVLNTIWPFLEMYVCLQNFVDSVSEELMCKNWWNIIFSCILI